MSRLDRRGRDPEPGDLRNLETADVANKTIVPNRPTGVFRTPNQDIALNRAYQRFGRSKVMQQFVNRYLNEGGTSPLFGKNAKIVTGPLPPTTIDGTFTQISDNGGTSIFLEGPTNKDSFEVGDTITIKSNDNIYNNIVADILVIGAFIIVDTPFMGNAGPGTYSKEI